MKPAIDLNVHFYQRLGELFYAIAAADKVVKKIEYATLRTMVTKEWKDMDDYEDAFHTDAAYQIEVAFDWFDYEERNADECFDNFKDFYKENTSLFSIERKRLIWQTADAIASSFSGKNKSEVIMLARLKILLEQ